MESGKTWGEFLEKIADELERRLEEIGRLITLENGKPLAQSYGELAMAVDHLRWFGGAPCLWPRGASPGGRQKTS